MLPRTNGVHVGQNQRIRDLGQASSLKYCRSRLLTLADGNGHFGQWLTGRLWPMSAIRKVLTYGIGSMLSNDTFNDGDWKIVSGFAPALLEKGIASTKRQLNDWYEKA